MNTKIAIPVERAAAGRPTDRVDIARQQQSGGAAAARALNVFPLQPGVLIQNVTFTSGTNTTIVHKLGDVPRGWFLVAPRLWDGTAGQVTAGTEISRDKSTIVIGPFGTFTADCWVF